MKSYCLADWIILSSSTHLDVLVDSSVGWVMPEKVRTKESVVELWHIEFWIRYPGSIRAIINCYKATKNAKLLQRAPLKGKFN